MDGLYANFIKSDDLVFDIGAHVGDRIRAFRRLEMAASGVSRLEIRCSADAPR